MYDGQNVTTFKVKIVDFGADGAYQGGDDKEFEITRTCLKRMEQLKFRYQNLGLTTNRMLHNSYFQVLLEQSTSIMSILTR
jgi:hypothetical protein